MRTPGPATAYPTRCPRFAPLPTARGAGAASSPGHREYAAFGRLSHPSRGRDTCPSSRRFRCGGPVDSPQRDDRACRRAGGRRSPGSAGRGAGGRARPPRLPLRPSSRDPAMSTDITSEHRRVFETLTSGQHSNIALFSVLASRADLRRAAELRPVFYRDYVALEQRIGHTLSPSRVPPAGVDRCSGRARRRRSQRVVARRPDLPIPSACRSFRFRGRAESACAGHFASGVGVAGASRPTA